LENMVDHLPAYPEPPADLVEKAKRDIPELLSGTTSPTIGANLVRALQKPGHSIAAGHWAIHQLIKVGLLTAEYRANFAQSYSGKTESGTPFVCVGETIPPKSGPGKYASFTVMPTDALWAWWKGDKLQPAHKGKQPNINARMLDLLTKEPACAEWTAQQFADKFHCSKGTVGETEAWKQLRRSREMSRLDREAKTQTRRQLRG
jgi:hypothetical protein